MDQITVENFRCFRERQNARLAPLTLLVGENSTGKTSFMAMIRALWDTVYRFRIPDFKEEPYDLGSFDEIAHHRGAKGGRAETFKAGLLNNSHSIDVTFERKGTVPVPTRRRFVDGDTWIEDSIEASAAYRIQVGTCRGSWERQIPDDFPDRVFSFFYETQQRWDPFYLDLLSRHTQEESKYFTPLSGSPAFEKEDHLEIFRLAHSRVGVRERPFASAPVRSKPRRTYDPARPTLDPEGYYIPMYLADVFFQNKTTWTALKKRLEEFGKDSGLFDELSIKPLGKRGSEPFQVRIRKFGGTLKGPKRNLLTWGMGSAKYCRS